MERPIAGGEISGSAASEADSRKSDDAIKVAPVGLRDEEKRAGAKSSTGGYPLDDYARDALSEVRMLLAYASSSGIAIDPEVSDAIAQAREAQERNSWNAAIEARFWPAKAKLSHAVRPVTVESLAAGAVGAAAKATRTYFRATVILSAIILPISIVGFINTSISNDVTGFLRENDAAAVSLHQQLLNYESALEQTNKGAEGRNSPAASPPDLTQALLSPNIVDDLAQFARVSRQIFSDSQVLNAFILRAVPEPDWANDSEQIRRDNLELDVRAGGRDHPSIADVGFEKIATYQDIRAFAKQVQEINLVIYGAITAYILPIAYALLGACAFALRNMAAQTGTKTYQPSYSNRARLIIALIAGTVVGLFNNFTQGVSVSPLAIAFLVGYAVEVFFSFLDGFVHSFERTRSVKLPAAGA
jgi:hypothetical protein